MPELWHHRVHSHVASCRHWCQKRTRMTRILSRETQMASLGPRTAHKSSPIGSMVLVYTWWLIPLSKWVITPVISGLTLLIPFITGVITHLRFVGWATKYANIWGILMGSMLPYIAAPAGSVMGFVSIPPDTPTADQWTRCACHGAMGQQNQGRIAEWKARTSGSSPLKPIGSMYGIYSNIGDILMVNVTIYRIHGSYGKEKLSQDVREVRRPMKHAMKALNEQAWQDLFWQDLGRKPKADRTCQKEPNASQKQEGTIEKKTQKIINPSLGLTGGVHTAEDPDLCADAWKSSQGGFLSQS